ncbi:MAG: endonuclease III [Candidatus Hodarchaeota archaeon]
MNDLNAAADKKKRILRIIDLLKNQYPNPKITLRFTNPLHLLIATMLSAQCTDERVNQVTEQLFKKYKGCEDFVNTPLEELEHDIKPTGFYKNKARHIKGACTAIIQRFNSHVPGSMEELISLPGVARKTANIVLSNGFGIIEGIAVDTHVRRLSRRLGVTEEENPNKIEADLMNLVPRSNWNEITLLLIKHGRGICKAKRPLCDNCSLNKLCPSAFKV